MAAIMDAVHQSFSLLPGAEVSIECNPGTVTAQKFAVYRQSGINRISLGLQSAQNVELKMLGRIHTWEQFIKTYELARAGGFSNINVDLMSSLPGQHIETYADSLQKVCRLKPEHVSAYSLIIEKGSLMPATMAALQAENFRIIEIPYRPTAERLAYYFYERLTACGYHVHRSTVYETPNNCASYEE